MDSRHDGCQENYGDTMSKWNLWKRVMKSDKKIERAEPHYCCQCGGRKTRQTTLDEFFDLTPITQERLFPVPTQRIGMGGKLRRYRGGI